jgi:HEAT repeat protein
MKTRTLAFSALFLSILLAGVAHAEPHDNASLNKLAEHIWIQRVNAGAHPTPTLTALSNELLECGISYEGKTCLDSAFSSSGGVRYIQKDAIQLFAFILKNNERFLVLIQMTNDRKKEFANSVSIFQNYPSDYGSAFFDHRLNNPVLSLTPGSPNDQLNNLRTTSSIRSIYHTSKEFLNTPLGSPIRPVLLKTLSDKSLVIQNSPNELYLFSLLSLLRDQLPDAKELATKIALKLQGSREYGKTPMILFTLGENGVDSSSVHSGLREFLSSGDLQIRLQAIQVLNSIRNQEDEFALISHLDDSNFNVSNHIYKVASDFNLKDDHISHIAKFLYSQSPETRRRAVTLIAKIPGSVTTDLLLQMLPDDEVRWLVTKALETRPYQDEELKRLQELLRSKDAYTRMLAIEQLARVDTPAVNAILIQSVGDDSDLVRGTAYGTLRKRKLTSVDLRPLEVLMDSPIIATHWMMGDLIGSISDPSAIPLLIKCLGDTYISREMIGYLMKRKLAVEHVEDLKKISKDHDAFTRDAIVNLLADIVAPESTTLLIEMLPDEDKAVASDAKFILFKRAFNDKHIESLGHLVFASPAAETREAVAMIFGEKNNPKVLLLLQKALEHEIDRTVRYRIETAIREFGISSAQVN